MEPTEQTHLGYPVGQEEGVAVVSTPRKRRRPQRPYIRAAPIDWTVRAAELSLCALRLALALLHLRGMRKSDTFRLALPRQWQPLLSRKSKSRALKQLEAAGLVRIQAEKGQRPMVTLLAIDE